MQETPDEDRQQIIKAIEFLFETIEANDEINAIQWGSALLLMIMAGSKNAGNSFADFKKEITDYFNSHQEWYENGN
jgi:hypothetical protein